MAADELLQVLTVTGDFLNKSLITVSACKILQMTVTVTFFGKKIACACKFFGKKSPVTVSTYKLFGESHLSASVKFYRHLQLQHILLQTF